jgi:hypothetical protein
MNEVECILVSPRFFNVINLEATVGWDPARVQHGSEREDRVLLSFWIFKGNLVTPRLVGEQMDSPLWLNRSEVNA